MDSSQFSIQGSTIDLDAAYPKITPGSWLALVSNEATAHPSGFSGYVELYQAKAVSYPSRTDFGLSGKVTRIQPDTDENLDVFRYRLRQNLVLGQSEPLAVSETPLGYPLYGSTLALGRLAPDIAAGRALALSGKRARVRLRKGQPDVTMPLTQGGSAAIKEGDSLRLLAAPEEQSGSLWLNLSPEDFGQRLAAPGSTQLRLSLLDRDGRDGLLSVAGGGHRARPGGRKGRGGAGDRPHRRCRRRGDPGSRPDDLHPRRTPRQLL